MIITVGGLLATGTGAFLSQDKLTFLYENYPFVFILLFSLFSIGAIWVVISRAKVVKFMKKNFKKIKQFLS
jgi:acyl-coenzyme A synthetase/AMP-(fatty) acid ligase